MSDVQPSFTDAEYGMRRRITRRQQFLAMMDQIIPWGQWCDVIRPFYYDGRKGRKPVPLETILRMYLLQVWFDLSDEGVEDQVNDSYAMRWFMKLDFTRQQVPDATTLLGFRHLMEAKGLGEALFDCQNRYFEDQGWIMRGGSVVDATIISAPCSTKNKAQARDPQMHQTRKGQQWYFGFKAHIGVDAGTGFVHTVTVTPANTADVVETTKLVREDDQVVYGDAGYAGVDKRDEVVQDRHLSGVAWRIAARKSKIAKMALFDQGLETRKASVRSKVEHQFLILKRDFGFYKTRYRGLAKNLNRCHVGFACANFLMRARAQAIDHLVVAAG
jgi:IS5 family transposase